MKQSTQDLLDQILDGEIDVDQAVSSINDPIECQLLQKELSEYEEILGTVVNLPQLRAPENLGPQIQQNIDTPKAANLDPPSSLVNKPWYGLPGGLAALTSALVVLGVSVYLVVHNPDLPQGSKPVKETESIERVLQIDKVHNQVEWQQGDSRVLVENKDRLQPDGTLICKQDSMVQTMQALWGNFSLHRSSRMTVSQNPEKTHAMLFDLQEGRIEFYTTGKVLLNLNVSLQQNPVLITAKGQARWAVLVPAKDRVCVAVLEGTLKLAWRSRTLHLTAPQVWKLADWNEQPQKMIPSETELMNPNRIKVKSVDTSDTRLWTVQGTTDSHYRLWLQQRLISLDAGGNFEIQLSPPLEQHPALEAEDVFGHTVLQNLTSPSPRLKLRPKSKRTKPAKVDHQEKHQVQTGDYRVDWD